MLSGIKEKKHMGKLKNYVLNDVNICFFFIKLMLNGIIEMEIAQAPNKIEDIQCNILIT